MKVWLLALLLGGIIAVQAQDWDRADRATRRLPPSAFADLPAEVRTEVERRGCTVPQPITAEEPANVIKGRFTSPGRTDWAVPCSRQRRSSILVFRGGSVAAVAEIASESDIKSLQVVDGNGAIGYSRTLAVADAEYIFDQHETFGGPQPPPLDHDGIDDVFIEKGSVVWYWYQGSWLRLQGVD